jgi:hypothetical protein
MYAVFNHTKAYFGTGRQLATSFSRYQILVKFGATDLCTMSSDHSNFQPQPVDRSDRKVYFP